MTPKPRRTAPFLTLVAGCLALSACQHQPVQPPVAPPPVAVACPPAPAAVADAWLARRDVLCRQPLDEQRTALKALAQSKAELTRTQVFEQVLLATCRPDMTPGLLRQALARAAAIPDWADSERHLLQMAKDFDQSQRQLEDRNAQLKNNLNKTLDGIRSIEEETDNLPHGGAR